MKSVLQLNNGLTSFSFKILLLSQEKRFRSQQEDPDSLMYFGEKLLLTTILLNLILQMIGGMTSGTC